MSNNDVGHHLYRDVT